MSVLHTHTSLTVSHMYTHIQAHTFFLMPRNLLMTSRTISVLSPWTPFKEAPAWYLNFHIPLGTVYHSLFASCDIPPQCTETVGFINLEEPRLTVREPLVPTMPWVPAVDYPSFHHPLLLGDGLWRIQNTSSLEYQRHFELDSMQTTCATVQARITMWRQAGEIHSTSLSEQSISLLG